MTLAHTWSMPCLTGWQFICQLFSIDASCCIILIVMISDAVEISILTADSSHKGVHLFHEGWEQLGGGFKGTTPRPPPPSLPHDTHKTQTHLHLHFHLVRNDTKSRKKGDTCGLFPHGSPLSFADPMLSKSLSCESNQNMTWNTQRMDGSNCRTSIECRMVCSGNFYNPELSTAAAAGQVEVLSPGSSAATAPTESCRRGAGVAGVALALPSLPGTTWCLPGWLLLLQPTRYG